MRWPPSIPRSLIFAVAASLSLYSCLFLRRPVSHQSIYGPSPDTLRSHSSVSSIIPESIFVYRAYLDERTSRASLFILAAARCIDHNVHVDWKGKRRKLSVTPIESSCPWKWSPGCEWNSFIMRIPVDTNGTVPDKITLYQSTASSSTTTLTVHLHRTQPAKEGLTVCVPPLYWYYDWPRMLLFIEIWLAQGASQFLIYRHSTNSQADDVLKWYEERGGVSTIPWPLLPSSPSLSPSHSSYRLLHLLAHNDCVMRMDTRWGVLVDIDEFLVSSSGNFSSSLTALAQKHPRAGAFSYTHKILQFHPPLQKEGVVDFEGVDNARYGDSQGPNKLAFVRDRVDLLHTHDVSLHSAWNTQQVDSSSARLLHDRYNMAEVDLKRVRRVRLTPPSPTPLSDVMARRVRSVFHRMPPFNPRTPIQLGKCLVGWRKDNNQCKTPIESCKDRLSDLEDWRFVSSTEEQSFHII